MKVLHINILDKKATYQHRDGDIVCGNSDYVIEFAFDAEWDARGEKIARFIWNSHYQDVTFTGTTCPVPIITNTTSVEVGVYAGELSTTTPAIIGCQKSILCQSTEPGGTPFIKGEKGDPGVCTVNVEGDKAMLLTGDKMLSDLLAAHDSGLLLRLVHFHDDVYTVLNNYKVYRQPDKIVFHNDDDLVIFGVSSDGKETISIGRAPAHLPLITDTDNNKVLGTENGKAVWIDPPATSGGEEYVVNLLYNANNERYTTDKTVTEIANAIMSEKNVQIVRKDGTSHETWSDFYLNDFSKANNFIHIFAANAQNRVDVIKDGSDEYVTITEVESSGTGSVPYKVINLNNYAIPQNALEAQNLGELFATAPLQFMGYEVTRPMRITAFADTVKAVLTEFNTVTPIHVVYSIEYEGMHLAYEITSVDTLRENGTIHQVSFGDTMYVGEVFGETFNTMADIRIALNEDGSIVFSFTMLEPVHFPFPVVCSDCGGTGWSGDCDTCGGTGHERCDTCWGNGEVDCTDCYNTGTRTCDSCAGTGQRSEYVSCDACGGSGSQDVSCDSCGGSGNQEVSCDYCGGSGNTEDGEQCQECGGTGNREEPCGSCGGSGTRTEFCGNCGGQGSWEEYVNCDACTGSGGTQCENCHGTGTLPCNDCNNGYRESLCPQCEGSGSNWCNTCGGTGSIEI